MQKHQEFTSRVSQTIDAVHTSNFFIFLLFIFYFFIFWHFGTFFDDFNGPKTTRNGNLHSSVISAGNMKSIRCQIRFQGPLISVKRQKILYWKLSRGLYFSSNGPIYIFNFICLYNVFVCLFFRRKNFSCLFFLFLIGSDGPPYTLMKGVRKISRQV